MYCEWTKRALKEMKGCYEGKEERWTLSRSVREKARESRRRRELYSH